MYMIELARGQSLVVYSQGQ